MSDKEPEPHAAVDIEISPHTEVDMMLIRFKPRTSSGVIVPEFTLPMTSDQAFEFVRNVGSTAVYLRARTKAQQETSGPIAPEKRAKMN